MSASGSDWVILAPILIALGVLAVFSMGALFGAAITESEKKRRDNRPPLMQLSEEEQ